jgi:hypothetical protein
MLIAYTRSTPRLVIIALTLLTAGCGGPLIPSNAACAAWKISGTWERISTEKHPSCVGMIVRFNQGTGQGVVQSAPAACAFVPNEVKWMNLDEDACTWYDLRRVQDGSGFGSFGTDVITVSLQGQELVSDEGDGQPVVYRRR